MYEHTPGDVSTFEKWESEIRAYCRVYPRVWRTAENARITDEHGDVYLDFFAGAGVLNYGHNEKAMTQAVIDYLSQNGIVHSLDLYTTAKRHFIERFAEIILEPRGWDYRLQFTGPTGTNAVEAALKLARKATGRQNIVAFTNGFHGMTLGALAATGNSYPRGASGVPLTHVHRAAFDGYLGGDTSSLEPLRRELADSSSGLDAPAAFLVEPIQAEGGVNVASAEWLLELQELAREHGSLLILDEIQVANGRTGQFFSFDGIDGLDPDIVALAKGIGGNGLPLALLMIKPERDIWAPGEHTGTFRGQDLSFVAGAEGLRYYEDDSFLTEVRRKGALTQAHLAKVIEQIGRPDIELRGKGLIWGVDTKNPAITKKALEHCFDEKLVIASCGTKNAVLKLMPPLTIPDEDLERGLDIIGRSLTQACQEV